MTDNVRVLAPGEFDALFTERRAKAKAEQVTALTEADAALLREYLELGKELDAREPQRLPLEAWDEIMPYIREHGEIPPAYVGRVGVHVQTDPATGEEITGYYDLLHEKWAEESRAMQERYHDTIVRALRYALTAEAEQMATHPQVDDLISVLLASIEAAAPAQGDEAGGLLSNAYLPMLNGALTNDLMEIATKSLRPDQFTGTAKFTTKSGHVVTIENFDKLQAALGTSAKKLLDVAAIYLAASNYYSGQRITPTVEIPLVEFGEACGKELTARVMDTDEEQQQENKRVAERIKTFRKDVRRDLHDISSVLWSGEETTGRNKGDYREMRIISSHSIRNGILRINFDVDAAAYLVSAYVMQFPTALFLIDNRKPNAYVIGRKLALHNSIDSNYSRGTNNTLSVLSLLAAAPEIQSIDALQARGQRNWKDKVKRPLEAALDECTSVGLLSRWEYRDPTTQTTYTAETAQSLSWARYSRLMVDFVIVDAPDQTARREAIADRKAKAAASEGTGKRKGGKSREQRG